MNKLSPKITFKSTISNLEEWDYSHIPLNQEDFISILEEEELVPFGLMPCAGKAGQWEIMMSGLQKNIVLVRMKQNEEFYIKLNQFRNWYDEYLDHLLDSSKLEMPLKINKR